MWSYSRASTTDNATAFQAKSTSPNLWFPWMDGCRRSCAECQSTRLYRKDTLLCSAGAQVTHDVPPSVVAADIPTINKDDWTGAPDSKPELTIPKGLQLVGHHGMPYHSLHARWRRIAVVRRV